MRDVVVVRGRSRRRRREGVAIAGEGILVAERVWQLLGVVGVVVSSGLLRGRGFWGSG